MSSLPSFTKKYLGSLAKIRRGITYSADMLVERDEGLPYVNMKSFKKGGGFNKNGLKFFSGGFKKDDLANDKDLLIANTDVTLDGDIVGIPAYLPEYIRNNPVLFSHHVTRLRLTEEIDAHFLYYLLNTDEYRRWMHKYARGTTVLMLDMQAINNIPIHFPIDIIFRLKIVKILSTIDRTIEKTEKLIEKYQQLKTGLMRDLFTRGIGSDGKLRPTREQAPELYHATKIGWIPKDWKVVTCQDVCEKIIDCKNRTPPITADGYPVIRTPNVRHGEFKDRELVFTDLHSYIIWTARGKPKVDDVVITREAPVGEVCKIPERHAHACLGQRMMLYRTDPLQINNDFFLYALQSEPIQLRLDLISGGSTVGHVRVGDIRDLWMYQPASKVEQTYIGNALNSISTILETEKIKLKKLMMQKTGLMHDLLTGKKSVSVDAQETTHV